MGSTMASVAAPDPQLSPQLTIITRSAFQFRPASSGKAAGATISRDPATAGGGSTTQSCLRTSARRVTHNTPGEASKSAASPQARPSAFVYTSHKSSYSRSAGAAPAPQVLVSRHWSPPRNTFTPSQLAKLLHASMHIAGGRHSAPAGAGDGPEQKQWGPAQPAAHFSEQRWPPRLIPKKWISGSSDHLASASVSLASSSASVITVLSSHRPLTTMP
mmetsp:Transcript_66706/g.177839  ORF Transcript_66706/g.177839 Transcript_66706/m.177839 type:complete len:217 (+) Transcript_66706:1311-1961(+)